MVLRKAQDRLRARSNFSIAEVEFQDLWQRAKLAAVTVGPDHAVRERRRHTRHQANDKPAPAPASRPVSPIEEASLAARVGLPPWTNVDRAPRTSLRIQPSFRTKGGSDV